MESALNHVENMNTYVKGTVDVMKKELHAIDRYTNGSYAEFSDGPVVLPRAAYSGLQKMLTELSDNVDRCCDDFYEALFGHNAPLVRAVVGGREPLERVLANHLNEILSTDDYKGSE